MDEPDTRKRTSMMLLVGAAVVALILGMTLALPGCEEVGDGGTFESIGEEMDRAIDEAGDKVDEAGDKVEEAADEADEALDEAAGREP